MDDLIGKIVGLLLLGGLIVLISLVVAACFYDWKGDRTNLAKCGDEYRECVRNYTGCLTRFNLCRGEFSTSREEWAKVIGDVQTLNAITSENRTSGAAMSGALVGGMIGGRR